MVFAIGAAVLGAGVGLYNANKQGRATDTANENNMASYNQYRPYVDAGLAGGSTAFNNTLNTGAYQGDTYAGPNQYQTNVIDKMGSAGSAMVNNGYNMYENNSAFGTNSRDLYNRNMALGAQSQDLYGQGAGLAGQNQDLYGQNQSLYNQNQGIYNQFQTLSDEAKRDRLGIANQYAMDNANPLADAAMRDPRRQLEEQTLTGIDMAAQGSGNTNSSRAGVQAAVANRAYDDRLTDTRVGIQNNLVDRSLASQARQFADQSNALTNSGNALGAAGGNLSSASMNLAGTGSALNNQGNLLNNTAGQYTNAGAANRGIMDAYNQGISTMTSGGDFGMTAGNQLQGFDQARLNDNRSRFEDQRDFDYNRYNNYMSAQLGAAPTTSNQYEINNANPLQAGIFGAQGGFGFANQNPNAFGQFKGAFS